MKVNVVDLWSLQLFLLVIALQTLDMTHAETNSELEGLLVLLVSVRDSSLVTI